MQQTKRIEIPKFQAKGDFWREIRSAVKGYFVSNNISEKGDWRLFSKTIVLLTLFILDYCILVFVSGIPWWISIPLCILLAGLAAGIGFCIMHDAIHGSYSKKTALNHFMGLSLNMLGANNALWRVKHNEIHHPNVNIDEWEEDIDAWPLLRMHDNQKRLWFHRYQYLWLYWMITYSLLYISWVWFNDYKKYFTKKVLYKRVHFTLSQHVVFWVSKVFYITFFVVVPIITVGFTHWLIGYLLFALMTSLFISVVFQLAHIVEGVGHPVKETAENEFALHQLSTTADFATGNKFLTWILGGLNFQIEHHLFTGISHIHYPALHKIIKPICEKWGITFFEHPSIAVALKSHIAELKRLGQKLVVQL